MLKSVLKQRVNIQFCILNESSATGREWRRQGLRNYFCIAATLARCSTQLHWKCLFRFDAVDWAPAVRLTSKENLSDHSLGIVTILTLACMAYPQSMQPIPANVQLAGFKSEFAEVNGTRLHYVRGGSGPGLILLHGFPEDWYEFRLIMPSLAKMFTGQRLPHVSRNETKSPDLPGVQRKVQCADEYTSYRQHSRRDVGINKPVKIVQQKSSLVRPDARLGFKPVLQQS
jgi:hypothetical protein